MALLPSVDFLIRYDDTSLLEEVSGEQFSVRGSSDISVLEDGMGMGLRRDQYTYLENVALGISTDATISFWLLSKHPGSAKNTATDTPETMKISVLDFGTGSFDTDLNDVVLTDSAIVVFEEALVDGTMQMAVQVDGATLATVRSGTYEADKWHHFAITFAGGSTAVSIIVDGVASVGSTTGTIPASVSGSSVVVSVNRLALTPDTDVVNHNGSIDDLLILDEVLASEQIQKIVNYGLDYEFDPDFQNVQEVDLGIIFDDPTPLRVTDMYSDGSYIFATRNNGQVLRGSTLLWEVRRDFSDTDEEATLRKFGDGVKFENGFLKITNGTVAL